MVGREPHHGSRGLLLAPCGCGSNIGTRNGTLANGNKDWETPGGGGWKFG